MNIIKTGRLGYIESHAVVALAQNRHTATIVDNLSK